MAKRFCWCCNAWRNCRVQWHTTLHSIIPQKIFLQCVMMSVRVFLELLEALQRAKTAIDANLSTTLERGISNIPQIRFPRSETVPFNFVSFLGSFSSKSPKTQPVLVALNLVGVTSITCVPSIQSKFSQINKLI